MWYAAGDLLCGIYIYMAAVVGLLKIIHVSLVSSVILRRKLFTPAWVAHSNLNCHKVRPGLSSFTFAVSMPDSMKMLTVVFLCFFFCAQLLSVALPVAFPCKCSLKIVNAQFQTNNMTYVMPSHYLNQWWPGFNWTLGTNFSGGHSVCVSLCPPDP